MAANPETNVRMLDCGEAINAAFREEMRRDERVVMWGEDVITMESPTAGADLCTRGLFEEFGVPCGDRSHPEGAGVESRSVRRSTLPRVPGIPSAHLRNDGCPRSTIPRGRLAGNC